MIATFGNEAHAFAIAKAAGAVFNPKCDVVISSETKEGKLLGGVIYQEFTGASIGCHIAGFDPRWLSKKLLWILFSYPFEQLQLKKIFVQVPTSNPHSLEFCTKLGFNTAAILDDVYPNGGLVIMEMRREDCRWTKVRRAHGQEE